MLVITFHCCVLEYTRSNGKIDLKTHSHSIVARVHGVLLHFLSSIRCYLVSYRPNQFRIKG